MQVLVQIRPTTPPQGSFAARAAFEVAPVDLAELTATGLVVDNEFAPVVLPTVRAPFAVGMTLTLGVPAEFSFESADVSSLVRGAIPDGEAQQTTVSELLARPEVMGVFSDPVITTTLTCPGDPPLGDAADVALRLDCANLHEAGFTGANVRVAIVDCGIDERYLRARGRNHPMPRPRFTGHVGE